MTKSELLINWDIINSLAEDEETKAMILGTFIESFQSDLKKLLEVKTSKNFEQLVFIAHTIKGASSNFCNDSVINNLKDIEQNIKSNPSQDTEIYIEGLERITNAIIDELQTHLK